MNIGYLDAYQVSPWHCPKMRSRGDWWKASLCLSIQAHRAAAGSFLLAFKWLPYKSGAASMSEQVWQYLMWPVEPRVLFLFLPVSFWSTFVIACVSWGFLCLRGFLSSLHLPPLMCGLKLHFLICVLILIRKLGHIIMPCKDYILCWVYLLWEMYSWECTSKISLVSWIMFCRDWSS